METGELVVTVMKETLSWAIEKSVEVKLAVVVAAGPAHFEAEA